MLTALVFLPLWMPGPLLGWTAGAHLADEAGFRAQDAQGGGGQEPVQPGVVPTPKLGEPERVPPPRGLEPDELTLLRNYLHGDGPWQPAEPPTGPAERGDGHLARRFEMPAGWSHQLRIGAVHYAHAAMSRSPGRLETRRLPMDWSSLRITPSGSSWRVEAGLEIAEYRFRGATGLVPNTDDPTEDVYRAGLGLGWRGAPDGRWTWFWNLRGSLGGELDARVTDSFAVAALAGATYKIDDGLGLSIGALGTTQLESDPKLLPFLGLEWDIAPRWRLGTRGPGFELSYDATPNARAFFSAVYDQRQYRFDDVGPLPEGVMRDRWIETGIGLEWDPGFQTSLVGGTRLRVFGGTTPWRELTFLEDERAIGRTRVDPTLVLALTLALRW